MKLAEVDGTTVYLDVDAAGWGWFTDATPWESSEYGSGLGDTLEAVDGSAAEGRVDLLTVLLHEFGHLLGLDHCHRPHGIMADVLESGTRRGLAQPPSRA